MVTAKCTVCNMEFPDTHPSREGNKFCIRDHFNMFKKEHGTWNKGMKWREMYSKEINKRMRKRITSKGKEHYLYGRNRIDVIMRNLLNNPMKSKEYIKDLKNKIKENPEMVIDSLVKNMVRDKKYAYQRIAYEFYGRKCAVCGKTEGQIDVHHKDRNRKNNKLDNLIVLCPKHHAEEHTKDLKSSST